MNRRREGRNPGVGAPFPGPGRFQSEYWKDIVPAWLVDEQMLVQDSRAAKPIGGIRGVYNLTPHEANH